MVEFPGDPRRCGKATTRRIFIEENGSIESLNERWLAGDEVSWLGGPAPLEGSWPVNADGKPLAHVATLCLHIEFDEELDFDDLDIGEIVDGSPRSGYLTVYHDLEGHGATWMPRHHGSLSGTQPMTSPRNVSLLYRLQQK